MTNKKIQHTGIMNKMRDKMPLIIIILIIAFLATIVFEWGINYGNEKRSALLQK